MVVVVVSCGCFVVVVSSYVTCLSVVFLTFVTATIAVAALLLLSSDAGRREPRVVVVR